MQSMRSTLVGLTAASLLVLPGQADATTPVDRLTNPAPQQQGQLVSAVRYNTTIRFLDFDHSRSYGSVAKIRGQVIAHVDGERGAIRGVRVKLYRQLAGNSRWRFLDTAFTDQRTLSSFRFKTRAKANASYRVVFGGNRRLERSRNATNVSVYRRFKARLEDGTGRFHGRVRPHYAHRSVQLEKRACARCDWSVVRTDKTGDRGRYGFKLGAPRHGRNFWRLQTPPSNRYVRSYSGVFSTKRN